MDKIQRHFCTFIGEQEGEHGRKGKEITVERVYQILLRKFVQQNDQESIFAHEFFQNILRRIAEVILNVVYSVHLQFVKIEPIVPFVTVLQHLVHEKTLSIPPGLLKRLQSYVYGLIALQSLESIRAIFEESQGSGTVGDFYQGVYKKGFCWRTRRVAGALGVKVCNCELPLYLLQSVVEQKEGGVDYESRATGEWVILSLIYFVLATKCDIYRQKPVFEKILGAYSCLAGEDLLLREFNGDEVCDFYNRVVLRAISKVDEKELERLLDEIKLDPQANLYLVTPVQNENNTILDNIVFSSSWEQ